MKSLILVLIFISSIFADMGDCFTCHPKLIKGIDSDKKHNSMLTCIKCHSPNKKSVLECGEKCFSCHKQEDLEPDSIPQHKVFEECRECHVKVKEKLLDITNTHDQSHVDSLKDFLDL